MTSNGTNKNTFFTKRNLINTAAIGLSAYAGAVLGENIAYHFNPEHVRLCSSLGAGLAVLAVGGPIIFYDERKKYISEQKKDL